MKMTTRQSTCDSMEGKQFSPADSLHSHESTQNDYRTSNKIVSDPTSSTLHHRDHRSNSDPIHDDQVTLKAMAARRAQNLVHVIENTLYHNAKMKIIDTKLSLYSESLPPEVVHPKNNQKEYTISERNSNEDQ